MRHRKQGKGQDCRWSRYQQMCLPAFKNQCTRQNCCVATGNFNSELDPECVCKAGQCPTENSVFSQKQSKCKLATGLKIAGCGQNCCSAVYFLKKNDRDFQCKCTGQGCHGRQGCVYNTDLGKCQDTGNTCTGTNCCRVSGTYSSGTPVCQCSAGACDNCLSIQQRSCPNPCALNYLCQAFAQTSIASVVYNCAFWALWI